MIVQCLTMIFEVSIVVGVAWIFVLIENLIVCARQRTFGNGQTALLLCMHQCVHLLLMSESMQKVCK
ncbi:conserved hypothetical protein [Trichinella spiralis]|uniref:hypothetical protein n=1 Tax=Trichinella spiralis TaxID=6334 RepID=UPI0001EFECA6|nr:conserved hypothetical protein [Trichinella spiralis]